MAQSEKEILSTNQIVWLIFSTAPVGITTLPREINHYAQQSGWITLLAAASISLLFSRFYVVLASRYPGESIITISYQVMGKTLGLIFLLLQAFFFMLASGIGFRLLVDGVITYLLFHTPAWVLVLSMLLVVFYTVSKGIGTLARMNEIIQPLSLILMAFILMLTLNKADFTVLTPLISNHLAFTQAMVSSMYTFLFIPIIPFLFPYIPGPKKLWRGIIGGISALLVSSLLLFIFAEAIFGPVELDYTEYPSIDLARIIRFPLLERAEIVFMFFWIPVAFTVHAITAYTSLICLQGCFPKVKTRMVYIFVAFCICVTALFPTDVEQAREAAHILSYAGIGLIFTIAPLLIVDTFKQRRKRG